LLIVSYKIENKYKLETVLKLQRLSHFVHIIRKPDLIERTGQGRAPNTVPFDIYMNLYSSTADRQSYTQAHAYTQ